MKTTGLMLPIWAGLRDFLSSLSDEIGKITFVVLSNQSVGRSLYYISRGPLPPPAPEELELITP